MVNSAKSCVLGTRDLKGPWTHVERRPSGHSLETALDKLADGAEVYSVHVSDARWHAVCL